METETDKVGARIGMWVGVATGVLVLIAALGTVNALYIGSVIDQKFTDAKPVSLTDLELVVALNGEKIAGVEAGLKDNTEVLRALDTAFRDWLVRQAERPPGSATQ